MADVVLVRWPEEREEADGLVAAGATILYLVDAAADPPEVTGCLEDWVRTPGDDRDLRARVLALEARAAAHRRPPSVDGSGRLRFHGGLLALPLVEARLARALAASFGDVVPDEDLAAAIGEEVEAVRGHVAQLRSRVRPLDLLIRRVRRQGYALTER